MADAVHWILRLWVPPTLGEWSHFVYSGRVEAIDKVLVCVFIWSNGYLFRILNRPAHGNGYMNATTFLASFIHEDCVSLHLFCSVWSRPCHKHLSLIKHCRIILKPMTPNKVPESLQRTSAAEASGARNSILGSNLPIKGPQLSALNFQPPP